MPLTITPPTESQVPELARICYEAFGALHDRHNIPRDFVSQEMSQMVLGMLIGRPDFSGHVAHLDGRIVGSNFLQITDALPEGGDGPGVAGVGPITVDPAVQAKGIGRALMQAVLDDAARRGVAQVRLLQEAVNATSLSLYTSLGFSWVDAGALMDPPETGLQPIPGVRELTAGDLPAADELCRRVYCARRRNEVAAALQHGFPAFVRERDGRMTGYLLPGFFGHAVADAQDDLVALLLHAGAVVPPMFRRSFVPLSQPALFRTLLSRGYRTVKLFNVMAVGPYEAPGSRGGAWLTSIGF